MNTRSIKSSILILGIAVLFSSCYSYTTIVGKGPQGNQEVTAWNHYLINGLAPVGVSDPKKLADGATDYSVFTRMTFVNGLVSAITFGIYSPTTTTVRK